MIKGGRLAVTEPITPPIPDLTAFQRYLRETGWNLVDEDARTSMWAPEASVEEQRVRVVLPVHRDVTDYASVAHDALRALAFVERRSPAEIASDVGYGGADTVVVRLSPPAPPGEAPLLFAYDALGALHNLVVGSASALSAKALVLPLRRPRRAEAYADQTRVSTAAGSFILSLAMPLLDPQDLRDRIAKSEEAALMDVPSLPFGRRVTRRMLTVVPQAQRLADEVNAGSRPMRAFAEPVPNAANATELSAIAALGGPDREPYGMRWALSPLAHSVAESHRLTITPGQQRVLAEAADFLRARQPRPNVSFSGLVVRLFRERSSGPGEIVIQGVGDDSGAQRRYRTELDESSYAEAMRAHKNGLTVTATGDIEVRGTRLSIRPLVSFAVVQDLGDDD